MVAYQLTMFYSNLAENKAAVQQMSILVAKISDGNWHVLKGGAQVGAIVFATDKSEDQVRATFHEHPRGPGFLFLLARIDAISSTNIRSNAVSWLQTLLAKKSGAA